MGGAVVRDLPDHHRRAAGDGLVPARGRSAAPRAGSACAPRRRPASRRAATPRCIDAGRGPVLRAGRRHLRRHRRARPRSTCAASCRPGRRCATRTGPGQRAARHRPRPRPQIRELARADRVRVHAGRRDGTSRPRRHRPAVALRLRGRDRHRRGGRPPLGLRPHRAPGAHLAPAPAGSTPDQKARREVRRLLRGLGLAEVLPLPFLAPGDLERCGLAPVGIELDEPDGRRGVGAAHFAAARAWSRRPRYNHARRSTGVSAVRDRPRLPAAAGRPAAARRA